MNHTQKLQRILNGIERVARTEILRDYRPDSCIASSRIVLRVLQHYGYNAEPLTVRAMVFNPAYHLRRKAPSFRAGI